MKVMQASRSHHGFNDSRTPRSKMSTEEKEKERIKANLRTWERQINACDITHIIM